jgi:hypothetical protein
MFTEHSDDFQLFLDSFEIKNRKSSEDLDIEALFRLNSIEKEAAEDFLIKSLTYGSDPRVPRALHYLKSKKSVPALIEAIKNKTGLMLIESALALWFIAEDTSVYRFFLQLLDDKNADVRISAAFALQYFDKKDVVEALCKVLKDDDVNLVRANCIESLFKIFKLIEWDVVAGRGIGLLRLKLSSDFENIRIPAIEEMIRIATNKKNGKSAEELGITISEKPKSEELKKVLKSISGSEMQSDFDIESILKLKGEEKEWCIYTLFFLLQRRDIRAVRALTKLNIKEAIIPFREMLNSADGMFRKELENGISELN